MKKIGIYEGINCGLKAATGDYIVILDSGDVLNKDAIKNIVQLSQKSRCDYLLVVVQTKIDAWIQTRRYNGNLIFLHQTQDLFLKKCL